MKLLVFYGRAEKYTFDAVCPDSFNPPVAFIKFKCGVII